MKRLVLTRKELKRFLGKVRMTPGCWEWTGTLNKGGYAVFFLRGINRLAHRVAYEHFTGHIQDGTEVDHLCSNPACVKPAHLEAVTHQENVDRSSVGRYNKTHCVNGHPLSGPNCRIDKKTGDRKCRACERIRSKRLYYKKKRRRMISDSDDSDSR